MTERRALYELTESVVQRRSVKMLRDAGWYVHITAQDKATRKHVAGLPDAIAFRDNHTLLIEFKGHNGAPRQSQIDFRLAVNKHEGPNLRYLLVFHPSQLRAWVRE